MDEKSINWEASIKLNPGFTVDELRDWFVKYPNSGRLINRVCRDCGRIRDIRFCDYRDLCFSCTMRNNWDKLEFREKVCVSHKEYWDDSESHIKASLVQLKRYKDPKAHERQSIAQLKRYNDPEKRLEHKKLYESSILCHKIAESVNKFYAKLDDPGLQPVMHHVAYDFNNPDALTVEVTRSFHAQIHHPKGIPVTERGYSLVD